MPKTANTEEETEKILFWWVTARTDPTPYKVYGEELEPASVMVEVEIPRCEVINHIDTTTTITPRGMALAMSKISKAISSVYSGDDES